VYQYGAVPAAYFAAMMVPAAAASAAAASFLSAMSWCDSETKEQGEQIFGLVGNSIRSFIGHDITFCDHIMLYCSILHLHLQ
jgi:hypothetical protein